MKRYYGLLSVIFLLTFFSCASYRELTKQESEVVVNHDVNLLKPELKTKLLTLVSEKFNSGRHIVQVNEDGLITGNTTLYLSSNPALLYDTYMELSFMIKYQDKNYRCKYVVKDLYNADRDSTYDIPPRAWGRYADRIKTTINDFDNTISEYIAGTSTDF